MNCKFRCPPSVAYLQNFINEPRVGWNAILSPLGLKSSAFKISNKALVFRKLVIPNALSGSHLH